MIQIEQQPGSEKNKEISSHNSFSKKDFQDALDVWKEQKETSKSKKDIQKIVQDIVSSNLSPEDLETLLAQLPIDKRLQAENMIIEAQRSMIATMSQERFKQHLQMQFPQGVPENVGDMALSLITDTSEMYKNVKQEIAKTGIESSDHEKQIRRNEQRIAIAETQKSEEATAQLSYDLSHIV